MVRKGEYTNYNGEEYRLVKGSRGKSFLISNASKDLKKGFERYADGVYQKEIDSNEVGDVYYIHPYAIYRDKEYDAIVNEKKKTVNLGTSDSTIANSMGFDRTDKYYYEKIVPLDEVILCERKKKL
ncbi:hypothetical protein QGM71_16890 [Virgibacillus sp. C22-A2]|uniref:Uncharacterized protein n=1 Tax=Virgibacillus tibetensis TaxID=3042313 RepID=A0ABU6KJ51_9BACI|nr:hypothetical protein [Virgibacillus sp. C22-A2]